MSSDIGRIKRKLMLPVVIGIFLTLFFSFASYASLDTGLETSYMFLVSLIIIVTIFLGFPLALAILIMKTRFPKEPAIILARGWNYFWINEKGVWRNNKLMFTWDQVRDVQVIKTWFDGKEMKGNLKVFLNDKNIEINNTVDPNNIVSYIKNVYLKR
ncbi:hypothetical protein [Sulfuracidifex tepidarius]|uniref:Uncharacterized protein n=1 Tax=Sulfuracidifex tepidarius TaxID=1294262 RepID=A0A510E5J1_9CREN|nr:hypothetical protein [Sulfuracidifex tepidarius]BBG25018.1 hypothetical protein IC006_2352 [Sulfuracidifex tepidarius]BBG27805.1 hypothetical protein IC007_2359 [Sulfuracidifex tepidarius]